MKEARGQKKIVDFLVVLAVVVSGFLIVQTVHGGSSVPSTVQVSPSTPTFSSVFIDGNNPSSITLTANATTTINVEATISDNNGCTELTGGTTTILLYRSGVTSSTCFTTANNLDCYQATTFTASSTCSGGSINTTTTFAVQYYAQATDASSSFPNQNWIATLYFTTPDNVTGTVDTTHSTSSNEILTLTALNVTTSSINYGILAASSTTGAVNQVATTTNAGNSTSSLQLSASATLTSGSNSIATSSQHYATSTFTFGGAEQSLTGVGAPVAGFLLTAPTSTTNVNQDIFWGLIVPNGTATGTYNGTNLFTAVFHS